MNFEWREDYAIGNHLIDREHKNLFDLIGKIASLCANDADGSNEVAQGYINELLEYAATHFEHEEELLESLGYPDLGSHATSHQDFSERMVDLVLQSIQGTMDLEVLVGYLHKWLRVHILEEDFGYKVFLEANQLKSPSYTTNSAELPVAV